MSIEHTQGYMRLLLSSVVANLQNTNMPSLPFTSGIVVFEQWHENTYQYFCFKAIGQMKYEPNLMKNTNVSFGKRIQIIWRKNTKKSFWGQTEKCRNILKCKQQMKVCLLRKKLVDICIWIVIFVAACYMAEAYILHHCSKAFQMQMNVASFSLFPSRASTKFNLTELCAFALTN